MRLYPLRIIFLLPCLFLALASCRSHEKEGLQHPPVDVTDFVVEPKTLPAVFEFVGFAESSHPVEIRARVEGYLDKIAYQEGQLVHQGDLLFQLDPRQYEAKVAEAKGEVSRQNALLANAVLTVNRLTPLYEQKAASKKDLDNAISNKLAVEAALESAEAALLEAKLNLSYTTILSPIEGYADRAKYREGALITPGTSGLLTTVSIINPIWVYFNVPENDILRTRQQEIEKTITLPYSENKITLSKTNQWKVQAIMSDGTVLPQMGEFNYSSPTYDQSTSTLVGRAVFANPEGELRPGQFVRVKVYGAERPNALFVPQRALMQKSTGLFVFLIKDDGKVSVQDVEASEWFDDYQIITNGLKPGDRIVVDGINKLYPGMTVHVVNKWSPPSKSVPSSPPKTQ